MKKELKVKEIFFITGRGKVHVVDTTKIDFELILGDIVIYDGEERIITGLEKDWTKEVGVILKKKEKQND